MRFFKTPCRFLACLRKQGNFKAIIKKFHIFVKVYGVFYLI